MIRVILELLEHRGPACRSEGSLCRNGDKEGGGVEVQAKEWEVGKALSKEGI